MQLLYAWQWVAFHLGIIITAPVVLGSALQLDVAGIAALTQRVFLLTGIASLLQVCFGHRLMLVEGPAAPWWAAYVILADLTFRTGGSIELFRSDLQGAMLIVGLVLMLAGAGGLIRRLLPFFTPPVTGSILMLLAIQIGGIGVKNLLGAAAGHSLDLHSVFIAMVVVISIVFLSIRGRGVWQNGAVLLGIMLGWLLYYAWGPGGEVNFSGPLFMLPGLFPWGQPTFNPGLIITLVLLGLVLMPNVVASITAMDSVLQTKQPPKHYDRGLFFTGVQNLLTGCFGAIGSISFTISVGLVAITGLKERLPFILSCFIFMLMGLLPSIGILVASIPPPVANGVLLVSASPLVIYAIKDFSRCRLDGRDHFVLGLSLLVGVGVMMVPAENWYQLPYWAASIVSNGVITGSITCIIMEHFVLRQGQPPVNNKLPDRPGAI